MTLTKLAIASAIAAAAFGAHAVPTYTVSTDTTGTWGTTASYTAVGNAGVTSVSNDNHAIPADLTAGNSYFYVSSTGSSLTLNNVNANSFSFLWGTPDAYNSVTFNTATTSYTFGGSQLSAYGFGLGSSSSIVFSASNSETIQSVTFQSSAPSFEFAVAAVPEPETYALMAAGLLAVGFVARRNSKR